MSECIGRTALRFGEIGVHAFFEIDEGPGEICWISIRGEGSDVQLLGYLTGSVSDARSRKLTYKVTESRRKHGISIGFGQINDLTEYPMAARQLRISIDF